MINPNPDYAFRREPRAHQLAAWLLSRDRDYFALFMEYGTGKTKVSIDTAAWLWDIGKINAVLIMAPKSVYRNWYSIDAAGNPQGEIPKDLPTHVPYRVAWFDAQGNKADDLRLAVFLKNTPPCNELRFLLVNTEALVTDAACEMIAAFLRSSRCLFVVDESTMIKHETAVRTKRAIKLSALAPYRRILSGNPYANSPLDIYAQAKFLSPKALGFSSFFSFKARFAKLVDMVVRRVDQATGKVREFKFKKVDGYRDLDELKRLVARFSFTVKKADCLDLPPKVMLPPRAFDMQPRQRAAYEDMKKYSLAELDAQGALNFDGTPTDCSLEGGRIALAEIVLTKLLRLQQIACGFVVTDTGEEVDLWSGSNPRIDALMEAIEETDGKVIVWAPFKRSVAEIAAALTKVYGPASIARYDGTITRSAELEDAKRRFQEDPACRFFLSSQSKGGRGLTLTAAHMMLFYANTFDQELREQAEDRAHRDGLDHSVGYADIQAIGSNDPMVLAMLMAKKGISDLLREGTWKDLF